MKNFPGIIIAAAFLASGLAGCAGNSMSNLEHVAGSYVGYGAEQLVAELGDAQSVRQVGAAALVMTYMLAESAETGNLRDPLTSSATRVMRNAIIKTCTTDFTLEDQVVVAYAIDWDNCASLTGPR